MPTTTPPSETPPSEPTTAPTAFTAPSVGDSSTAQSGGVGATSTASGNALGSGTNGTAAGSIDDGPFAGMRYVPYVIGLAICLLCVCVIVLLVVLRQRRRKQESQREARNGGAPTVMHDLPNPPSTRMVEYLQEPDSDSEALMPPNAIDSAMGPEPITEVHIEWVNDSMRESERESQRGYQGLPVTAGRL